MISTTMGDMKPNQPWTAADPAVNFDTSTTAVENADVSRGEDEGRQRRGESNTLWSGLA